MKKFLSILILICITMGVSLAQSTAPRWGTLKNQINTGIMLTFKKVDYTFVSGVDTLDLSPSASETYVQIPAMTDSLIVKISSLKASFFGDKIYITTSASAATRKLKFSATNLTTAGTASPGSGKRVIIVLMFEGTKWVEVSRYVES
jgi:hypothetical protein